MTNRGRLNLNAPLTWEGGLNDGGSVLTINSTATVSEWNNAGVIVISNGGVLNNHLTDATSYGGGRITVNSGGTLNADSQNEGVALDLQDSLLVNNGIETGTVNAYYGATVSGSGSFGPINVLQAGALVAAASAVPAPTSLTVNGGSISGAGNLSVSATLADAILATPNPADTLTLAGNLSGPGPITKTGAGTLILSGDNTYGTGTNIVSGTVEITSSDSILDGSNLTVGVFADAALVRCLRTWSPPPGSLAMRKRCRSRARSRSSLSLFVVRLFITGFAHGERSHSLQIQGRTSMKPHLREHCGTKSAARPPIHGLSVASPRPTQSAIAFVMKWGAARAILATAVLLGSGEVWGANQSWQVSSGDWSIASNWSGNLVPTAVDTALVSLGRKATIDQRWFCPRRTVSAARPSSPMARCCCPIQMPFPRARLIPAAAERSSSHLSARPLAVCRAPAS